MTTSNPDGLEPEFPEDEGLAEPELPEVDVEGARLLGNEARDRLRADGFTDSEIDAWVRVYFEQDHEGTVEGLVGLHRLRGGRGTHPGGLTGSSPLSGGPAAGAPPSAGSGR